MEIKQYSPESSMVKEEIKEEIKDYLKFNKMTAQHTQINGYNKSSVKRKVLSTKCLHKEVGKNPTLVNT